MKTCAKCREVKALTEFSPDKKHRDGKASYCRPCATETARAYRRRNQEAVKSRQLQKRYGIDHSTYLGILTKQRNCCAVCGVEFGESRIEGPCVDHCHTTGSVRGLLCQSCNQALGLFKDSVKTLNSAIDYLRKTS